MFLSFFFIGSILISHAASQPEQNLDCPPGDRHRSRAKPYFPSFEQGGFIDMTGSRLNTLQDFLAGEAPYVTLSLDSQVPIPVGTPICIPEMNRKYNKNIVFKYSDTGTNLQGKEFTVCHICVHNETFADDKFFAQFFTLVIPKNPKAFTTNDGGDT